MKDLFGRDMVSKKLKKKQKKQKKKTKKTKKTKVSNFSGYNFKFTKILEQKWMYNFTTL